MTVLPTAAPPLSPDVDETLRQAVQHHQAGRLDQAERLYGELLRAAPNHADAHHNLGVLALASGRMALALPHLKAALEGNPAQEQFWLTYIEALMRAGHAEAARRMLDEGQRRGLRGERVETLAQLLREGAPAAAEIGHATGLFDGARYADAEAAARNLVARYPHHGFGWKLLGVALKQLGRLDEALEPMRRAAQLLPDDAGAQHNLAVAFLHLQRPAEAEATLRRVLMLQADHAEAQFQLGHLLRAQGRYGEAEAAFRRTAELRPDYADAHINLGNALQEQGRMSEAEASYRRALEIAPERPETHGNLGNALRDQGRLEEAGASFRRALALQPQAVEHALHAGLLLPPIPASPQAIDAWRHRFEDGIAALSQAPDSPDGLLANPGAKLHLTGFYLAYHDRNDRALMESLCRLFRARVAGIDATAPAVVDWRSPAVRGARIRLGILSEYLAGHTIGKLYQGFVSQLDRQRFEVVVIHAVGGKPPDPLRQAIDALADRTIMLPAGLAAQQRAVGELELDVLLYPDIGMSPTSYFLAFARLAPVQVVSWGHPDTSGLDTLDYFLSATGIEPEGADAHYSERLIRLNRIPCFYQPLAAPNRIPGRMALGLPESGTLYACPQTLFKFHPDFDAVLAQIAEGDPAGHILLLESHVPAWNELLRQRWAPRFPLLLERVRFLPRQPLERFMALLAHVDVLLDPLHFGSGNTLYEGMVYGTPVVTWPGRFMRGRIVAGAYRQMGIADAPIAERIEDYAPLALALGRDPERRRALRRASMAAAASGLFADRQAVREFEAFLAAAVDAAGRGEKLPPGWRPDMQSREST